jgi:hypothetical protein
MLCSSRGRRWLSPLLALAALPAAAAVAAPSQKDISREINAEVHPAGVGKPSRLTFRADAQDDPNRNGRTPRAIEFRFARGFKINRAAAPIACDSGQARSLSCPARSQIGSASFVAARGQVSGAASGHLNLYLRAGRHTRPGLITAELARNGRRRGAGGRLVHIDDWVYSYALRIGGLDRAIGGRLERIRVQVGLVRTTERGGRSKRTSLIANPRICPGGWHYEVAVIYSDGARHWGDGVMSCTEG